MSLRCAGAWLLLQGRLLHGVGLVRHGPPAPAWRRPRLCRRQLAPRPTAPCRAPVPWQGIELEELPGLDATCTLPSSAGHTLDFTCQQLLSGPAGEALLARLQPSLASRSAALNVGEMRVALPPDAAQVLLPGGAAAAAEEPTPAPRQQRVYTGCGSGAGGRVVQDSGDDW